ncbi:bile acid:sodium symporter family protein [Paenibacillus daejeonensis]|uniref:bile acid:sodium symporter family protein n=1 Tax=Paenibacillus daejeonensis TaxID=135193 RepID=UPI001FE0867A|nr:bile acid:sodium symporter family protein [Paenibacillus daejeonensis]
MPYLFAFVTLTMAIGCSLEALRVVLLRPLPIVWSLSIAHIVLPLIGFAMGTVLFGADSPYTIGFVLFALIPLGVSSVIWVSLSGGSIALMLALVVVDSAISPLVVPAGIQLFFGTGVEVEIGKMMGDLLIIVVLPTLVGVVLNQLTRGRINETVRPVAAPLSKLCFVAVVALNASAIEPYVMQLKGDLLVLAPAVIALVGICYAAGFFSSLPFRDHELLVTLSYASGMRNISLGIVLALGYFSPPAAVPVVLGIMIQQPIATLHFYVLQKFNKRRTGIPRQGQVR